MTSNYPLYVIRVQPKVLLALDNAQQNILRVANPAAEMVIRLYSIQYRVSHAPYVHFGAEEKQP